MSIFNNKEKENRQTKEKAEEYYQVKVCDGELWLIYQGCLICPCSMLKDDAVQAVKTMQELYIKRHNV